jgi:hypothetical protein
MQNYINAALSVGHDVGTSSKYCKTSTCEMGEFHSDSVIVFNIIEITAINVSSLSWVT